MVLNLYIWSAHCNLWANVPPMECSPISGFYQDCIKLTISAAVTVVDYMSAESTDWLLDHQSHGNRWQNHQQWKWKVQAWLSWRCINPWMHSQHPGFTPVTFPVRYNLKFAFRIDSAQSDVEHGLTSLWCLHCVWLFSDSPVPALSRVRLTALPGG